MFFEWPATKQAKDCDERKETKCSGKSEFTLKGEQTFSAFWFLCKLNKKRKRSLFLFLCFHSFAPPQKRADSVFLEVQSGLAATILLACQWAARRCLLLCVCSTILLLFSELSMLLSAFTPSAFLSRTPCCDGESVLCSRVR